MVTHSNILPGESHGWRSLVGYSPRGCKELDTTSLSLSIFDNGKRVVFLLNGVENTGQPPSVMFMKMNSKQMKHLTVRPETVKLLEESIEKEKALCY